MLELVNLVKKYGTVTALDGVNLNIAEGSIFGFVGPNGAGKTTAFKIITGLLAATSGEVRIHGDGISASRPKLAERIGYMPDFFGVYDNLKVSEYMDFYAGTYYIPYRQRMLISARAPGPQPVSSRVISRLRASAPATAWPQPSSTAS